MTASMDLEQLASPDWLLAGFDARADRYYLARVSRDTYRASSFLDHRITPLPTETKSLSGTQLDEVLKHATATPGNWIFHTGFCCSTLLASCLDHPAITLVLREPKVLSLLAEFSRQHKVAYPSLYHRVTAMCERSYAGEALVIKPSNYANALAGELIHSQSPQPQRKAILMSCSLESLLISILKKRAEAEISLPGFLRALLQDSDYQQVTGIADPGRLHLLQQSVLFWHCQRYFLQKQLATAAAGSMMSLSMERFMAKPEAVLSQVSDHFNLELQGELIREIVATGAFRRHSKQAGLDYSPEAYRMDQQATMAKFATEIEQAVQWAGPLLEILPVQVFDDFEASG
jgi:hypothetical protein